MTTRTEQKGNLEYRIKEYPQNTEIHVRLIRCPVCAEPFPWNAPGRHLHIASHAPEDFGLSPLTHD